MDHAMPRADVFSPIACENSVMNELGRRNPAVRQALLLDGGARRRTVDLLSEVWLGRGGDSLVLEIPSTGSLFLGETVQRRLDVLARSLGSTSAVRRRELRRLARG
jgi:hypothetical protein